MEITLYNFTKRENSTKTPEAGYHYHTEVSGSIKEACSVTSPIITFQYRVYDWDLTGFNYAYIPNFKRYYFVKDWTFVNGLWELSLEIDVLASWASRIKSSTQYVVRSASSSDGDVIDTYYPAKTNVYQVSTGLKLFPTNNLTEGTIIIGILGGSGQLGVTYRSMTLTTFAELMKRLTNSDYMGITEISDELAKGLINPFQYLTKAFYLPVLNRDVDGRLMGTSVGWWDLKLTTSRVKEDQILKLENYLTIPKHPQSARGSYLNSSAYTRHTLYFPPFGMLQLDADAMQDASKLWLTVLIDILTGDGYLKVWADNTVINSAIANVATPIPLAQVSSDIIGAATSVASGIQSAVAGDFGSVIGNIGNAVNSAIPKAEIRGSQGGFGTYKENATLVSEFYQIADEDNEHRGRPLCKKVQLNSLQGYTQVLDADISITGTTTEQTAIKAYMEGGFYLE